ncbi:MAG: hypothetical protein COA78_23800 [Blastopirellula sp.]|nr:MAG: hypothetical protein COA78_23800 [Blastopirellula sp.]
MQFDQIYLYDKIKRMSIHVTKNELPDFSKFVQQLEDRGESMTVDQTVIAYRRYQTQLAQLRAELQAAADDLDAGLGTDLDMDSIIKEGRKILADEGITD